MSSLLRQKPKRRSYYPNEDCVRECPQEELLNAYKDWEPEVERFLMVSFKSEPLRNFSARFELCIEKPTRWIIHHLNPFPFYVSGKIGLVGDTLNDLCFLSVDS